VEETEIQQLSPLPQRKSQPAPRGILKNRQSEDYWEMLERTHAPEVDLVEDEYDETEELDDDALGVRGHKSAIMDDVEDAMRLQWNTKDLKKLSIVTSFLGVLATGILPMVDHFVWYRYDPRMTEITVTFWMVSALIGLLGAWAAWKERAMLVAIHVILGFMLGACLGTFSVSVYYDMESRCEVMQAAFVGCGGCNCSWTNECSLVNLTTIRACRRCEAWPSEICRTVIFGLGNGFTLTSIMGVLSLIAISVPVTSNLLMLLRMETIAGEAFKSKAGLDIVQLEYQLKLMENGEEPTCRYSALELLIDRLKDRGINTLADRASAALRVFQSHKRGPRETLKNVAKMVTGSRVGQAAQLMMRRDRKPLLRYQVDDEDEDVSEQAEEITPHPPRRSKKTVTYVPSVFEKGKSPAASGDVAGPSQGSLTSRMDEGSSEFLQLGTTSSMS